MRFLTWLRREPLVLFLVLGGLMFIAFELFGGATGPGSNRIVVDRGLIDHLASGFVRTWQRPPTDVELKGLVDDYVREEIATREAAAMGLDRDDTIIRRRMRQKLEFLLVDEAATTPVTDADLQAWLDRHPGALGGEPRVAFRQVYLRPDRHGAALRADADKLLGKLRANPDAAIDTLGDATMLPAEQPLVPLREVARTFGDEFSQAVVAAEPGPWTGPVESAYGLHLVQVREHKAAAPPPLAEVRPAVEREVQAERRNAQVQALYDRLLAKYVVTIERPPVAGDKAGAK